MIVNFFFSFWDVVTELGEEHVIISLSPNCRTPTPPQGTHSLARIEGPSIPLVDL